MNCFVFFQDSGDTVIAFMMFPSDGNLKSMINNLPEEKQVTPAILPLEQPRLSLQCNGQDQSFKKNIKIEKI